MTERTFDQLSAARCWELLERYHFGRIAIAARQDVLPMIMPINYLAYQQSLIFRTDPRSQLGSSLTSAGIAFEIDGIDEDRRAGWSVVARGYPHEVVDRGLLAELLAGQLVPWAPGERDRFIQLVPQLVTGREIVLHDLPATWLG